MRKEMDCYKNSKAEKWINGPMACLEFEPLRRPRKSREKIECDDHIGEATYWNE